MGKRWVQCRGGHPGKLLLGGGHAVWRPFPTACPGLLSAWVLNKHQQSWAPAALSDVRHESDDPYGKPRICKTCASGFRSFRAQSDRGIVPGQVTQPMVCAGAGAGLAGVGAGHAAKTEMSIDVGGMAGLAGVGAGHAAETEMSIDVGGMETTRNYQQRIKSMDVPLLQKSLWEARGKLWSLRRELKRARARLNCAPELRMWTMDGNGGSVAYFIMDGKRQLHVSGKDTSLRSLACSNRKTRSNGQWAEIVRAEQAWFLLRQSGEARDLGLACDRLRFYDLLSKGDELVFSSVRTLVVYKRTPVTEKHHNEAGFVIDFRQARAARFVTDLTDNWGAEYVNRISSGAVRVAPKPQVPAPPPQRRLPPSAGPAGLRPACPAPHAGRLAALRGRRDGLHRRSGCWQRGVAPPRKTWHSPVSQTSSRTCTGAGTASAGSRACDRSASGRSSICRSPWRRRAAGGRRGPGWRPCPP
jgi:hypothetical protein